MTKPTFSKIPAQLQERPQWVCWKLETRDGKPTKVPYSPATGQRASSTDPTTWATFEDAVAAHERGGFNGIGFVFAAADPFAGVDFDHVREPETGAFAPWARDQIKRLASYSELSQSGTGAHVIVTGTVPGTRRRTSVGTNGAGVEMYHEGRFFVMTGRQLAGTPGTVEERQEVLDALHGELFPAVPAGSLLTSAPTGGGAVAGLLSLSDAELVEKASAAKNGAAFGALWRGDWQVAGHASHSDADAALLGMLRFWTGGDKGRAFGLFAQSGLARDKWTEREDYRERTWAAVASGETYSPAMTGTIGGSVKSAVPEEMEPAAAYQPFPVDALPEPHRSLVTHGAEAIGCDPALVALPLLAATAGAIGNARRIQLKRGWCEPCVLWAVTVALSGDRKSPAFELGTDGLQQIEDRAFAELRAVQAEHKKALAAWRDAGASGEKPEAPTARRLIVRDVTVQSVAMVLAENFRGVTLARDELAAWVGGFDRFTGGKGEEAAHWLEMHRAGKVTADRKTGEPKTVHVPRAAVSVTGTIQPGTLERILERRFFENGLAARLLLAWPPRQLRTWSEGELDETILRPVREVFAKFTSLPMGADGYGNPQPVDLPLTPEAKARWIQFYDEHAAESHGLGDERLGSAWSKLEGATARFALVVHGIRAAAGDNTLADSAAVDLASIEAGIRLTNWFKGETRRIYGRLVESEDARDCRRVMECALAKGGCVTVRDVAKAGVCQGDPERITAAMDRLAAAGRGAWRDVPATERGGRPTRSFELSGETGETVSGAGLASAQPPAKPAKPAKPGAAGEVSPVLGVSGVGAEIEKQVSPVSPAEPQPGIEEGEL